MNDHLNLSGNELSLVSDGLQIMMVENVKNSKGITEEKIKQYYENLSLELFILLSRIKLPDIDKNMDFSFDELKLMKNGLMFLADYSYQKSLKKTEKNKSQYYEKCNLQFMKIRDKINSMESYTVLS